MELAVGGHDFPSPLLPLTHTPTKLSHIIYISASVQILNT